MKDKTSVSRTAYKDLLSGKCADPHSILGMHTEKNGIAVRVYDPGAVSVTVRVGKEVFPMRKIRPEGLFEVLFPRRKKHFNYTVEKHFADGSGFVSEDPYHFLPGVGEMDLYLFNEGEHRRIYDVMGAHVRKMGEVSGVLFAVCNSYFQWQMM